MMIDRGQISEERRELEKLAAEVRAIAAGLERRPDETALLSLFDAVKAMRRAYDPIRQQLDEANMYHADLWDVQT